MVLGVLQCVMHTALAGALAVVLHALQRFHKRLQVKICPLSCFTLQRELVRHVVHHGPLVFRSDAQKCTKEVFINSKHDWEPVVFSDR